MPAVQEMTTTSETTAHDSGADGAGTGGPQGYNWSPSNNDANPWKDVVRFGSTAAGGSVIGGAVGGPAGAIVGGLVFGVLWGIKVALHKKTG
jgi:hypothetical protein